MLSRINWRLLILMIGVGMAIYHMAYPPLIFTPLEMHQNWHLGFALALVFLSALQGKRKPQPLYLLLLVLGVGGTIYIAVNYEALQYRIGFPNMVDVIVGFILVLAVLEATRLAFGPVIPILTAIAIAYLFFGHYLPPPFYFKPIAIDRIASILCVGFSGIFGAFLIVSAEYIVLFMLIGSLLMVTRGTGFFIEAGKAAGRLVRSGAGQTAVISSGLFGMVTGAPMANVAVTGMFTIPAMKRAGYKPEQAGAIESVASTGGVLMPPIMGALAFIMAAITGIPYIVICMHAVLPAIIYYICTGIGVHLWAIEQGVGRLQETVDTRLMWLGAPLFLGPLLFLIIFLTMGFTPMYAAFYAIILIYVISLFRKETRLSLSKEPRLKSGL